MKEEIKLIEAAPINSCARFSVLKVHLRQEILLLLLNLKEIARDISLKRQQLKTRTGSETGSSYYS